MCNRPAPRRIAIGLVLPVLLVVVSACDVLDGAYLNTLTKLHNIKVAMPHVGDMVMTGMAFPASGTELANWLYQHAGEKPPQAGGDPRLSPVVDGWGTEIRITGDLSGYQIRSAGPDRIFDTPDDIYLAGDSQTEYIVDGVREMKRTGRKLLQRGPRVPFNQRTGFYRVTLPGGYRVSEIESGYRSEAIFRYSSRVQVAIAATPWGWQWRPEEALRDHVWKIKSGLDAEFGDCEVVDSGLREVRGVPGYEIRMARADGLVHHLRLVRTNRCEVTITVQAAGKDHEYLRQKLIEAVETTLVVP